MAKRNAKRPGARRPAAKPPLPLTPGLDPEPPDLDDEKTVAGVSERAMWRFFAAHNRAWKARPRSFVERIGRLREGILCGCERAGAVVARGDEAANAIVRERTRVIMATNRRGLTLPPGECRRFIRCAVLWPGEPNSSAEAATRRDIDAALSALGAAEAFHAQGEEGMAARELELAARACESTFRRPIESLAERARRQDPSKARAKRSELAKEKGAEQRARLLNAACAAHAERRKRSGRDPRYWDVVEDVASAQGLTHDRVEKILRKGLLESKGLAFRAH